MVTLRDDFKGEGKVVHMRSGNLAELYAREHGGREFKVGFDNELRNTHWYFDKKACHEAAEFFTRLADLLDTGAKHA